MGAEGKAREVGEGGVATGPDAGPSEQGAESEVERSNEDEARFQRRDEAVGTIEASLARRLKRALQDEQNDLLDTLRNVRGRPTADRYCPGATPHGRFVKAGRPMLDHAAKAGAAFAMAPSAGMSRPRRGPAELDDLAAQLPPRPSSSFLPLRRLEQAFADGQDDDAATLADSLGAAYREWKTQRIERTAADHVAGAFARGAFAATPEGTGSRWLVDDVDGPCPGLRRQHPRRSSAQG